MEGGKRKALSSSFLCSPIPKDPAQVFYVDDHSSRSRLQAKSGSEDSFLDTEAGEAVRLEMEAADAKDTGGYTPAYVRQLQERVRVLEKERKEAKEEEESESVRKNKRQRLEIESIAVSRSEELKKEVEMLRIQLENRSEKHQLELKERDVKLDQLRRQLQYAVTEEEETLKELKAATNDHAAEKIKLQTQVVELEARLQLVETSLGEWKEKAVESSAQLRATVRQSRMKTQLLEDELAASKDAATTSSKSGEAVLESKIRLLESQLKEKTMEAEFATSNLLGAKETMENAQDVRSLNEKIAELQSTEHKLKSELVDLIEASKTSSVLEERLYQTTQKLKQSEQRNAQLSERIEHAMRVEEAHKQFVDYFESIVKDPNSGLSLDELKDRPAATVIQLYRARQNAFEILFEQKGNVEIQRQRLEKQCEKLQSDLITSGNHCAKLEVQVAEFQEKIAGANSVVTHLRKVNEELVEILETYGKNPDDKEASELSAQRVALLESSLKQSQEQIKGMESTQKVMATPAAVKKYEARIERLEKALEESKHESNSLSKHLEKAEMELAIYEKRLGKGEFNVETTKIVHLAVNPTYELLRSQPKADDVDKLRQENAALRTKLDKLLGGADAEQMSSSSTETLTTTTSYETVEGLKKLNQRLKEIYGEQTRQYRQAVYLLTGYKIDLKHSNGMELLRLRSIFADHDDDELMVRMEADGSLELMETDFASQINQRVFAYLTTCRSFPAFLSTLTLNLFEKQTFQGN